MMELFMVILLLILLVCAIAVTFSRNLLNSILIFMSFSLVMSVIWMLLESPDLAITEAAVGAGVTTVLFVLTLKKIHAIIAGTDVPSQKDFEMDDIDDMNINDILTEKDGGAFTDEF